MLRAELLALVRRALALDELSPAARAIEERAIIKRLAELEALPPEKPPLPAIVQR